MQIYEESRKTSKKGRLIIRSNESCACHFAFHLNTIFYSSHGLNSFWYLVLLFIRSKSLGLNDGRSSVFASSDLTPATTSALRTIASRGGSARRVGRGWKSVRLGFDDVDPALRFW
jgi:hypothetical protein